MLVDLLFFVFVHITLLIPGYVVMRLCGLFRTNSSVEVCLGYVLGIVLYALGAVLIYAARVDPTIVRITLWALIISTVFIFILKGFYKSLWEVRFPIICLFGMSLLSLAFMGLSFSPKFSILPDPSPTANRNYTVLNVKVLNVAHTNANDNYIPYRQAQFFLNRSDPAKDSFIAEWGVTFFQRTPLMGAVSANYFNLLNTKPPIAYIWSNDGRDPSETYEKFQILAQIMNSLFIVPAFFLLSKIFNKRTASLTILLLIPSQFFLYNAFFTWPKSLVAFFILASWLLLFEKKIRYTVAAGIVAGISYLAHDLSVLYIGATLVYLLANRRIRDAILYITCIVAVALPWLFTSSIRYDKPSTFVYYPFAVDGIPQTTDGHAIISKFFSTPPFEIFMIRVKSLFYLLSPYQLIFSQGGQELTRRFWAAGLYSLPGALGLGLAIPAFISIFALFKRCWGIILLTLVPVLFLVLLNGWAPTDANAQGALHFAQASIVLWSGLGVYWMLERKWEYWPVFLYVLAVIQLVFFILYSYNFNVGRWINNVSDVILLATILFVLTCAGVVILQVIKGKKNWLTQ